MGRDNRTIRAIIWDFDGTLVDTSRKNFTVAKQIIEDVTGEKADSFPIFQSLESYSLANRSYKNWRDMYKSEYGFSEVEVDRVGSLWTQYQLQDQTPVECFPGLAEVVKAFKAFPQGIVSMNSRDRILQTLEDNKLSDLFQFVVGYEEVDLQRQKPEPDGLLMCIEKLAGLTPGFVFYIGDHETDLQCAANANAVLDKSDFGLKIITISAAYGWNTDGHILNVGPDYIAEHPQEIFKIISGFSI